MSVCSPCYDAGIIIDACLSAITFGLVLPNSGYLVDVKHNATNKIQSFEAISDDYGMLTVTGLKVDPLQGYTISIRNGENFTICTKLYECITFAVSSTNYEPEGVTNLLESTPC